MVGTTVRNMTTDQTGESRRSVVKKGILASGLLAVGAGASAGTTAAQDDQVLVFADDFLPGESFDVIARLQQSTTVDLLRTADEETVSEISQPDEWSGYVIRHDNGADDANGVPTFLFTEDNSVSSDDTLTLDDDASMFSPELNLLSTSID